MSALLGFFEVESRAADDDLLLEGEVLVEDVAKAQNPGLALVIDQGQHIDGEGGLKLGLAEEAV